MTGWEGDKARTDPYLPYIKRILGQYLISEAPVIEDQKRNTDLIVLALSPYRIAVRLRGWNHWPKYGNQFTIRCSRPSGAPTEYEKIMGPDEWGDYFFYGFMHPHVERPKVLEWTLGDLAVFRRWIRAMGSVPAERMRNPDGSSDFYAFNLYDARNGFPCVPPDFVVAKHREMECRSASLF